jgi:hypothetical protein
MSKELEKAIYSPLEKRYLIEQRVKDRILEHGSVEKAIRYCKSELTECEDNWGSWSSDCVGHAITCNQLLIPRLTELLNQPPSIQ